MIYVLFVIDVLICVQQKQYRYFQKNHQVNNILEANITKDTYLLQNNYKQVIINLKLMKKISKYKFIFKRASGGENQQLKYTEATF